MKTTLVIDDKLYEILRGASRRELGSSRRVSEYLDGILRQFLLKKKGGELFGSTKPFDLSGYREENDRFA